MSFAILRILGIYCAVVWDKEMQVLRVIEVEKRCRECVVGCSRKHGIVVVDRKQHGVSPTSFGVFARSTLITFIQINLYVLQALQSLCNIHKRIVASWLYSFQSLSIDEFLVSSR